MSTTNLVTMPRPKKKRKPNARVRGEGHLFLRNSVYWFELNWQGIRTRKSLDTTDRETALIKLDKEVAAIRAGELPKKFDPITVQAMFDAWMLKVETDCKPRTQEDYRSRWDAHLKAVFGGLIATQVDRDKVVSYLNRRMKEGAGLCARNREQRVLMMVFGHNKSKIPADRFPEFPKMQSERAHVRTGRLSDEDFEKLRKRLDDPKVFWFKAFLTMTFKYGFRKGECQPCESLYDSAMEESGNLSLIVKVLPVLVGDHAHDTPPKLAILTGLLFRPDHYNSIGPLLRAKPQVIWNLQGDEQSIKQEINWNMGWRDDY